MFKHMRGIAGGIVGLAALVGLCFTSVNYFATAHDLQLVAERLDQKIVYDRINDLQKRVWMLEDRYKDGSMPREVRDEIRNLKREIEDLQRKLQKG